MTKVLAVTADSLERGQVPTNCHVTRATMSNLSILLGRDLEQMDKVPVGNVLGMAGLSTSVLKSATLSTSTTPCCPPFVPLVPSSYEWLWSQFCHLPCTGWRMACSFSTRLMLTWRC